MITVIDYGLGNLASVANALKKLEIPYEISGDVSVLKKAGALILPGVGAANQGMKNLKEQGLDRVIIDQVKNGTPILGICLGMQLLLSFSEEGNIPCLGLIEGKVKKFDSSLKVPQIGWNQVRIKNLELRSKNNIFFNIPDNSDFYFVNSYYCNPDEKTMIKGVTDYGLEFCSVLEKDNLYGVQFHPEKSGSVGFQLLKNILETFEERIKV